MSETLIEEEPITVHERVVDHYERRYNNTTTLAAEMLDGRMRASFEFEFDGQELYASDGSALGVVFENAERDAYKIAAKDPRLQCEIRRRGPAGEKGEYLDMINMAKGLGPNTMVVTSDTPAELDQWGEDVGGYNFKRRQAMLRVICRLPDGRIRITSQSLDQSDRDGLERIHTFLGHEPGHGELLGQRIKKDIEPERQDLIVGELTGEYDRTLEKKFGRRYYAGRTPADMDNTYQFVCGQNDLLDAFLDDTNDENLFGLIAALENRWNSRKAEQGVIQTSESFVDTPAGLLPMQEMHHMAQRAVQMKKTYSGCGITMTGLGKAKNQLEALGYENDIDENQEWYGKYKKTGTCVNCHEGPKDVGEKSWCKDCIGGHCGKR